MQNMRLFSDVARCRSLSEAASLHGITQSAASQRVRSLEKHLGVKLLDRSVRPVSLTPAGKVYLKGCRELVARSDAIEQEVRLLNDDLTGVVRVFAMYSAGIGWMNQVQAAFAERCPDACVELHYDRPDDIHRAVIEGRCDLGLVSFPQQWPSVGSRLLRDEPMALVCPAGHPLAQATEPVDLARLTDQRLAAITPDLPLGRWTLQSIRRAGGAPVLVDTFDNIDTLKAAVIEGGCTAILPVRTVQREAASGLLKTLATAPMLQRPVGVIYDKGRGLSPVAAALTREMARHHDPPDSAEIPDARDTEPNASESATLQTVS
ncbi:MAG: LysR family transcriptional regulator [Planctomycetota bacterium]